MPPHHSMSEETIKVLKTTAPVIKEHGEKITRGMYAIMFKKYPEQQNSFNMSHQIPTRTGGSSPQAKSLASAVLGFAENCDNLGELKDAVERMVGKHIGFDILPEQYPIVGECLLTSIKETLGDAATDEIMEGWKNGYKFLADVLIEAEEKKRQDMEMENGGWRGFKKLVVSRKEIETKNVTSFYFKQSDGSQMPDNFKPGQYISVRFRKELVGRDFDVIRNYSLSAGPGKGYFRISVRRESSPEADTAWGIVSNHLHDNVHVGSHVEVVMPCGNFVLEDCSSDLEEGRPVVFISAGVGVTPMMSMLEYLVDRNDSRSLTWIHCASSPEEHPFKDEIDNYVGVFKGLSAAHVFYSKSDNGKNLTNTRIVKGHLTKKALAGIVPQPAVENSYYFTGPVPFMNMILTGLRQMQVPEKRIHYEFFGPTI